ncbi:Myb-like DNA-binding domain-containing protein [Spironucleus salmonicida]|uniref:Myb-like DNA-binding domain-containing protein n=1 Tax=Spironucleus salmonicida TaxID=348837 RepID=V6LDI4_9EUKA|nr:Myb-like DNA-binding domain-containing protein [Spironucleus salmonicida]|eukprot:EST41726.1 Myb-like DNA-binding domain-containing protein [Spironucleus salmonicida]
MDRYHQWSQQELDNLMNAVQIYGKQWNAISQNVLPTLSPTCLKNKFYAIQRDGSHVLKKQVITESSITKFHLDVWSDLIGIKDFFQFDALFQ